MDEINGIVDIDQNYKLGKVILMVSFNTHIDKDENGFDDDECVVDGTRSSLSDYNCTNMYFTDIKIKRAVCVDITEVKPGNMDFYNSITKDSHWIFQSVDDDTRYSTLCEGSASCSNFTTTDSDGYECDYESGDFFKIIRLLLTNLHNYNYSRLRCRDESSADYDVEYHESKSLRTLCILLCTHYRNTTGYQLGVYKLTEDEVPLGDKFLCEEGHSVFKLIELNQQLPIHIHNRVIPIMDFIAKPQINAIEFSLGSHPVD